MRFSAAIIANIFAWTVLICLIAAAFVMVEVLGPAGLVILGLLTLFVCTQYHLNDDVPAWSAEVFRARTASRFSPEQRAATREEKRVSMSPLRLSRWRDWSGAECETATCHASRRVKAVANFGPKAND